MSNRNQSLSDAVHDVIRAQLTELLGAHSSGADAIAPIVRDALVGMRAVCALTDLSRPQIWRGVAAGTFPKPLSPSPGRRAWLLSEINAWIAQRKAERDTGTISRHSPKPVDDAKTSTVPIAEASAELTTVVKNGPREDVARQLACTMPDEVVA